MQDSISKDYHKNIINKWVLWLLFTYSAITSLILIGIIPLLLISIILFRYYLVPKNYVGKYSTLSKIDERILNQQNQIEALKLEKLSLEKVIEDYRNNAYLEIDNEKEKAEKRIEEEKQSALNEITKTKENELYDISRKVEFLNQRSESLAYIIDERSNQLNTIKNEISDKLADFNYKEMFPINFEKDSSSDIKNQLSLLTMKEKELSDLKNIITSDDYNSRTHINTQKKQLIRTFDTECKYYFTKVKSNNFDRLNSNIIKSYETLNRLYKIDNVHLTKSHLKIKLEKLKLIHQHALKLEQEKELRREEKAILREQLAAERELEQKRKIIEKDEKHFNNEIEKLIKYMQQTQQDVEKQLYIDKIKELEDKLKVVEKDKENVEYRIAHAKAGYVYIISNIGSFGENIYKIGVTRRENPLDRIKDLSDASVPFSFDVHAIIFSEDAFKLEKSLHDHFRKYEVNKVNHRKEFFNVDIEEIKDLVLKEHNNTVNFELEAKAEQYRESLRVSNN